MSVETYESRLRPRFFLQVPPKFSESSLWYFLRNVVEYLDHMTTTLHSPVIPPLPSDRSKNYRLVYKSSTDSLEWVETSL